MPRRALVLVVATSALAPTAVAAAHSGHGVPPLAARLSACDPVGAGARSATFTGSMPEGARGGRLAMRFVLLERTPPAVADRPVPGAPFERWVTSAPGVAGLVHERRVRALRDLSQYRVEVRFRWYDTRGRVARTAVRRSPACGPA